MKKIISNKLSPAIFRQCCKRSYHGSASHYARILATDGVDKSCITIFEERGHQVDLLKTMPEDELLSVIGKYDGMVVRSATKVTKNVLDNAIKMRLIGRAGVGYDNIDVNEASKHGIMVMNTPGGNTVSTAQLALSLIVNLARKLPQADMSVKDGKWDRSFFSKGVELRSKTLGIIGCGRIGQVVAQSAKEMGMEVIGYDPMMDTPTLNSLGINGMTIDNVLAKSDFITVHTPMTPHTKNLLNDETLAKCKKGVQLVNCARGGIIDEEALLRALESGQVAGAALDVFTTEPPSKDSRLDGLIQHPNLICTPHLGASTEEAQLNVARDIAMQMCDAFDQEHGIRTSGDYFNAIVNASYLSFSTNPDMKPFMSLAETMGSILSQMLRSKTDKVESVTLKTYGARDIDISKNINAKRLLEACALKGIVKHIIEDGENTSLISAPVSAREIGLKSIISNEDPEEAGSYWNSISLEMQTQSGNVSKISGSVFGVEPHITKVNEYADIFTFSPDTNYALCFQNKDEPGAISQVLDILTRANVNLASMSTARASELNMNALSFISLDNDVPQSAMKSLKKLPGLQNVVKIQL